MIDPDTLPFPLPIPEADPKPWWRSRGVVGALATVAASLAGLLGLELDSGMLTELILQAVALGGGVLALWGRLRTAQPIAPLLKRRR